jgi:hypothetical protein
MRSNRRNFIKTTAAISVAGTSALSAQPAQQGAALAASIPWIGFLHSTALELELEQGFFEGLRQQGWEGDPTVPLGGRRQVIIRKIHGNGRYRADAFDDLKRGADDLKTNTSANLKLLVGAGGLVSGLAAVQSTTTTIPLLVVLGRPNASLAGNNKVGGFFFDKPTGAPTNQNMLNKISQLTLQYGVPTSKMCLLYNGNSNMGAAEFQDWQAANPAGSAVDASQNQGVSVENRRINFKKCFDDANTLLGNSGVRAIVVSADPFFTMKRARIIRLGQKAASSGLVMCYPLTEYFEDAVDPDVDDRSSVMSFGPKLRDVYMNLGALAGQVLTNNAMALSITQAQSSYLGLQ